MNKCQSFSKILVILFISFKKINPLSLSLYHEKEKCFFSDFYKNTNIIITYKITDMSFQEPKIINAPRFVVKLYSTEKNEIIKQFYSLKINGKFSYNIERNDHYKICVLAKDIELFHNKKFLLFSFKVQSNIDIEPNLAVEKDIYAVNNIMQLINSKLDQLENMQLLQNMVEDSFSKKQICNSNRIVKIFFCQILILILIGLFQIITLKNVFKSKIWVLF